MLVDDATLLLARELAGTELGGVLERDDVVATLEEVVTEPPHKEPLIVGRSAEPLVLVPWKPNDTDWPGAMLPFQPIFVAV